MRHSHRVLHAFVWIVVCLLSAGSGRVAYSNTYTVTDLGTLGGDESEAWDINIHGQIVGFSTTPSGKERAFLWLPAPAYGLPAGMNDLGTLSGGDESSARGINDHGQVVGRSRTTYPKDETLTIPHAFVWENGVMTDLGTPFGDQYMSFATAINDKGEVVGAWEFRFGESSKAFIWLSAPAYGLPAGMSDLGSILGLELTAAGDINTLGQIVGGATSDTGGAEMFLWLPEPAYGLPAGRNDLGTLGQGASAGRAMNDDGSVVGWISPGDSLFQDGRAMFWKEGVVTELGAPEGSDSTAEDINRWGQIVGVAPAATGPFQLRALLWNEQEMFELNELVPSDSGWTLEFATAINDFGRIVGYGKTGGETRAFLLTPLVPPIPAVSEVGVVLLIVLLAGAGTLIVLPRARPVSRRDETKSSQRSG